MVAKVPRGRAMTVAPPFGMRLGRIGASLSRSGQGQAATG